MKISRLLLVFCFAFTVSFAANAQENKVQEVPIANGNKALLLKDTSNPLISIAIAFRAGSLNDKKGREGTAYMLSGLLNEGAGNLKSEAFQTALKENAIMFSADVTPEMFYLKLQTPGANKEQAFKLLHLMLTELRLDRPARERVRKQIHAIHKMEVESPKEIAYNRLREEIFPNSPMGNKISGTPESIDNIRKKDLQDFIENNFARDNMFIGVSGDISSAELETALSEIFTDFSESSSPLSMPSAAPEFSDKVTYVAFPVPQSSTIFALPALKRDDQDFYALYVLNHIMGGSVLSSRLGKEIREKQGLVYGINTWLDLNPYAPLWLGYAATGTQNTEKVISLIRAEIKKIAVDGVSKTELSEAKTNLTGAFPLRFSSSSGMADMLMVMGFYNLGSDYLAKRNSYINSVSLSDIKRVAKRLLQPENLRFTVVGEAISNNPKIGE